MQKNPGPPLRGGEIFSWYPLAIGQKISWSPLVSGQEKMWSPLKISGPPGRKFWTLPKLLHFLSNFYTSLDHYSTSTL